MQENKISLGSFEITKLNCSFVQMRHRGTRKLYRYVEQQVSPWTPLCSELLWHPLVLQEGGLLYPCGHMTLQDCQSHVQVGEQEVWNTLEAVLQAIDLVHASEQVYNGDLGENILIDSDGNIRMYFPPLPQSKLPWEKSKSCDYLSLGLLSIQICRGQSTSFKQEYKDEKQARKDGMNSIKALAQTGKYSKMFICFLVALFSTHNALIGGLSQKLSQKHLGKPIQDLLSSSEQKIYDLLELPEENENKFKSKPITKGDHSKDFVQLPKVHDITSLATEVAIQQVSEREEKEKGSKVGKIVNLRKRQKSVNTENKQTPPVVKSKIKLYSGHVLKKVSNIPEEKKGGFEKVKGISSSLHETYRKDQPLDIAGKVKKARGLSKVKPK